MTSLPEEPVLLASGLGDDAKGGLFGLDGDQVRTIDETPTTGLATSPDGRRLARLIWPQGQPDAPSRLCLYDAERCHVTAPIAELLEPHGALWHGDRILAVSTMGNSILWLAPDGSVTRRFKAPGEGDCWHLNSLAVRGGRVFASAFGRFEEHRGWTAEGVRDGSGFVFDVDTGEEVIAGLTCPHDPLPVPGGWWICDSGTSALLRVDERGEVVRRRPVTGWARGLLLHGDRLYLGLSQHRLAPADGATATVEVLDADSLETIGGWTLPTLEVFALALVSRPLYDAICRTAATTS